MASYVPCSCPVARPARHILPASIPVHRAVHQLSCAARPQVSDWPEEAGETFLIVTPPSFGDTVANLASPCGTPDRKSGLGSGARGASPPRTPANQLEAPLRGTEIEFSCFIVH